MVNSITRFFYCRVQGKEEGASIKNGSCRTKRQLPYSTQLTKQSIYNQLLCVFLRSCNRLYKVHT